jgi:hypothetical protein
MLQLFPNVMTLSHVLKKGFFSTSTVGELVNKPAISLEKGWHQ